MIYPFLPECVSLSLSLSLSLPFTVKHFFSFLSNVINWLEGCTMNTTLFSLIPPYYMSKQSGYQTGFSSLTQPPKHIAVALSGKQQFALQFLEEFSELA